MMCDVQNGRAEVQGRYYLGNEAPEKCGYILRLSLGSISTMQDF